MEGHRTRRLARLVAGIGGALVLMAACSSGGGGSSGASTTTASTSFSTIPIPTTAPPSQAASGQGGAAAGGSAAGGATYTVQTGDYPIGIAKKLGVTLQALLDANGMTLDNFNLVPGQKLKVPSATGSTTTAPGGATTGSTAPGGATTGSTAPTTTTTLPGTGGTYTVQPNDYWAGIAKKLGVDAAALAAFNDRSLNSVLHPGDQLKVPPKSSPTTTKA